LKRRNEKRRRRRKKKKLKMRRTKFAREEQCTGGAIGWMIVAGGRSPTAGL
jgi:hypothetical protein